MKLTAEERAHRAHVATFAARARPTRRRRAPTEEQIRNEKLRDLNERLRRLEEEGRRVRQQMPQPRAVADDLGAEAIRAFGLDPETATHDDVQRVFTAAAKSGHSDRGGAADMGDLVKQRDLAREHIAARG